MYNWFVIYEYKIIKRFTVRDIKQSCKNILSKQHFMNLSVCFNYDLSIEATLKECSFYSIIMLFSAYKDYTQTTHHFNNSTII